jgi:very-short-patch-repair endonuclease
VDDGRGSSPNSGTIARVDWTDICARQAGVIALSQLRSCSVSDTTVDSMVHSDRLVPGSWRGVYLLNGAGHTVDSASWEAVLGTRSVLSYLSAASAWDVPVEQDGKVHVTIPKRRRVRFPRGVRVHRVHLDDSVVTERHGIPITTRVETVLDCIGWISLGRGRTLADRALQQRWISVAAIDRRLEDEGGRWGNGRLRALRPGLGDGAEAESERRLHRLLRDRGITGWTANFPIIIRGERYRIDVAFVDRRIAIEVDGFLVHSAAERFRSDRTRQNALILAGWTVLRFTWADLVDHPDRVIAEIMSAAAA